MQSHRLLVAALAAAGVLVGVLGWLNHGHRELISAKQAADAANLMLKHQIVADAESEQRLRVSLDDLLRDNAALRTAVEEAKAAAPGAEVSGVASLHTGRLVVQSAPRPAVAAPPDAHPPETQAIKPPQPVVCALAPEDGVSVDVDEVTLRTQQGNMLITGTAKVYREDAVALTRSMLASGRFQSALSDVATQAAPSPPRWGAALAGVCTASGCAPGAFVLFPPWPVLGVRVEAQAGVLGAGVAAAAGVRW